MIKFVLCDDNIQLLNKLKEMLESIFLKHDFDASVSYCANDIDTLTNYLNSTDADVLFLDVDFRSNINGIELAKQIRKVDKHIYIIFMTAHFEFIVSAFECKTFDFLSKPFSQSKLENTIIRLFDDFYSNNVKFIKLNNTQKLVNPNLINYIQKDGMRTIYNTTNGNLNSYGAFSKIETSLPNNFVRCHKSYIVNINNVSNIDFKNNLIFFKNDVGSYCFIGPKYKKNLMEVLNDGNFK